MRISLHLSGGLRAILKEFPPEMIIDVEEPAPLQDVLIQAGINPLLVMVLTVDGKRGEKTQILDRDAEIWLMGPVAGG